MKLVTRILSIGALMASLYLSGCSDTKVTEPVETPSDQNGSGTAHIDIPDIHIDLTDMGDKPCYDPDIENYGGPYKHFGPKPSCDVENCSESGTLSMVGFSGENKAVHTVDGRTYAIRMHGHQRINNAAAGVTLSVNCEYIGPKSGDIIFGQEPSVLYPSECATLPAGDQVMVLETRVERAPEGSSRMFDPAEVEYCIIPVSQ